MLPHMSKQEEIDAWPKIRKHQEISGLEKGNEIALKIYDFEVPVESPGRERQEQSETCARGLGRRSDLKAESLSV